ncbi:hypothetical protein QJS04_geneDACA017012 [Acorus gramineus]|uniref:Cytochrome P450 n=1 Tax=Acorus gramineus TaxID=55184 RepID=A0AAV9AKV1_ACOGR|nr:hypothetical protein QJS04_geneDACA017012 [Acorus gramineus]
MFIQPVCLAVILVAIAALLARYVKIKDSYSQHKVLPPGSLGLPLIGETIGFLRAHKLDKTQEWIYERVAKHGPVFKTSLLGYPTVFLIGAAGNRFVFHANDGAILSNQPTPVVSIMGKHNTFELNGGLHRLMRGAMSSFLQPETLQKYVQSMDSIVKQQIEFDGKESVKTVMLMKRLTFKVTCALLFAIPPGREQDLLFEDFTAALKGLWSLPFDLPKSPFRRAIRARERICKFFSDLIRERKNELLEDKGSSKGDVVSSFANLRDGDGGEIEEDVLIDNLITLVIGSHDTTAILLTLLIRLIARNEDVRNGVIEEQLAILKEREGGDDENLTWNDLQKMKYTWRIAQELMRQIPPVFGNFKKVVKDTSFGGFDIPKGWQVFWLASATHMDKNIFPDPERFDPTRFEGSSKSFPPFSYIPFGGGPHSCPGNEFARVEVLLIVHHLIVNYQWSEMVPDEPITRDPLPYPAMGLPIKLHPRKLGY